MSLLELLVGAAILLGLVGVVVPVLPGSMLVLGAIVVWAADVGTRAGWLVVAFATTFVVAGTIVKYAVPGRRLRADGVPASTLWAGALGAVVGFVVVPVLGLFLGFVLGVYAAERRRVGAALAWPATTGALRAVGLSILIELTAATLAAAAWVVGVAVT